MEPTKQPPSKLRAFYDRITESGAVSGLPEFDKFEAALADTAKRRKFYERITQSGAVSGLPDYDKFSSALFPSQAPSSPQVPLGIAKPAVDTSALETVPEIEFPEPGTVDTKPKPRRPLNVQPAVITPKINTTARESTRQPQAEPEAIREPIVAEQQKVAHQEAILARSREIRDNTLAFNEAGEALGFQSPEYQAYATTAGTLEQRASAVEQERDKLIAGYQARVQAAARGAIPLTPENARMTPEEQRRLQEFDTALAQIGEQRASMTAPVMARQDMDKVKDHITDLQRELAMSKGTPHEITIQAQLNAMRGIYSKMGMELDSFTKPESRRRAAENAAGALGRGAFMAAPALMEFVAIKSKQLDTFLGGVDPAIKDKEVAELASYRLAQAWREEIENEFPRNPEYANSFMFEVFPSAMGQLGSQILMTRGMTGLASKLGTMTEAGQTATGIALMGITAGGQGSAQTFAEAKEAGLSDEDATIAADWSFIPGAVVETIPVLRSLERMNQYTNGLVKPYFKNYVLSGLIGGAEESITEGTGQWLQNLNAIAISAYDKDRSYWEGMVEGGAAGGAAGFTANFIMAFLGGRGIRNGAQEAPTRLRAMNDSLEEFEAMKADPRATDEDRAKIDELAAQVRKDREDIVNQYGEIMTDRANDIRKEMERLERRGGADALRSDRYNALVGELTRIEAALGMEPIVVSDPVPAAEAEPAPTGTVAKPSRGDLKLADWRIDESVTPVVFTGVDTRPFASGGAFNILNKDAMQRLGRDITGPSGLRLSDAEAVGVKYAEFASGVIPETDLVAFIQTKIDEGRFSNPEVLDAKYPGIFTIPVKPEAAVAPEPVAPPAPPAGPAPDLTNPPDDELPPAPASSPVVAPEPSPEPVVTDAVARPSEEPVVADVIPKEIVPAPEVAKPKADATQPILQKIKNLQSERAKMRQEMRTGLTPKKLGDNPDAWFRNVEKQIRDLRNKLGKQRLENIEEGTAFQTTSGNRVIVQDGDIQVLKKDGNPYKKSAPGRSTAIVEAIEGGFIKYDPYIPSEQEWQPLSMDPKEGARIAAASGDPVIMANAFLELGQASEEMGEFGSKDDIIANYFAGDARVSSESIRNMLGKIAGMKDSGPVLLNWGGGKLGIDVYADEMSTESGLDITPQDIIEHMLNYPARNFKPVKMTPEFREMLDEFEAQFGFKLDKASAKRLAKDINSRFEQQLEDEFIDTVFVQDPESPMDWDEYYESMNAWIDEQFKSEGLTDEQIESVNEEADAFAETIDPGATESQAQVQEGQADGDAQEVGFEYNNDTTLTKANFKQVYQAILEGKARLEMPKFMGRSWTFIDAKTLAAFEKAGSPLLYQTASGEIRMREGKKSVRIGEGTGILRNLGSWRFKYDPTVAEMLGDQTAPVKEYPVITFDKGAMMMMGEVLEETDKAYKVEFSGSLPGDKIDTIYYPVWVPKSALGNIDTYNRAKVKGWFTKEIKLKRAKDQRLDEQVKARKEYAQDMVNADQVVVNGVVIDRNKIEESQRNKTGSAYVFLPNQAFIDRIKSANVGDVIALDVPVDKYLYGQDSEPFPSVKHEDGFVPTSRREINEPINIFIEELTNPFIEATDGNHRLVQARFNKDKTIPARLEVTEELKEAADNFDYATALIEAYQSAKKNRTNPELVKAVEAQMPATKVAADQILVDGVARPRNNNLGKPIHPTDEGLVNFWRWFGDSKVVDAEGRPLVVYHGTKDDVSEFDLEHWNRKDVGWLGTGVYATNSADIGNTYADLKRGDGAPNVMMLYARIENPYYATRDEKTKFMDMQNRNRHDARLAVDAWTREQREEGYDGVIYNSPYMMDDGVTPQVEYVMFNPSGVKSATGNSGAFDTQSGSLTDTVTDEQAEVIAPGIKPKNIRDMYRVARDIFGLNRVQALASAVAMDRMVGSMAARAGITKAQMYERLDFRKDVQENLTGGALFQSERTVVIDGQEVTLRALPEQLEVVNGFYSPIEKALLEINQDKGTASQFLAQIKKAKGVKGDELQYTGVEQYLAGLGDTKVSKQDILDFMRDNRIRVERVVYGETPWEQRKKNQWVRKIDGQMVNGQRIPDAKVTITEVDGVFYGEASTTGFIRKFNSLEEAKAAYGAVERFAGDSKYSEYTLPGDFENYRELLITYPGPANKAMLGPNYKVIPKSEYEQASKYTGEYVVIDVRSGLSIYSGQTEYEAIAGAIKYNSDFRKPQPFTTSHFSPANIIAHVRMNTREDEDGNKVLFIEEIQSDWAQLGRKKGFFSGKTEPTKWKGPRIVNGNKVYESEDGNAFIIEYQDGSVSLRDAEGEDIFDGEYETVDEAKRAVDGDAAQFVKGAAPEAPFVTDTSEWVRLALKSAIQDAVAQGATRIAWTTGDQQNQRYSLSKTVKKITAAYMPSGYTEVYIDLVSGGNIALEVDRSSGIIRTGSVDTYNDKKLSEVVGIELANKILSQGDDVVQEYEGDGLDVGGNGMRSFYDRIVPKEAKAVVKDMTGKEPQVTAINLVENATMRAFVLNDDSDTYKTWTSVDSPYTIVSGDVTGFYSIERDGKPIGKSFDSWTAAIGFVTKEYESSQSAAYQQSIEITPEIRAQVEQGLPLFQANGFHGSPYQFARFNEEFIGAGEGSQAFGWGIYISESPGVGTDYAKKLARHALIRKIYDEQLNDIDELMDPDNLSKFPPEFQKVLVELNKESWLGFDYPVQAIDAAYRAPKDFDLLGDHAKDLMDAIRATRNLYSVVFNEGKKSEFLRWDIVVPPDQLKRIQDAIKPTKEERDALAIYRKDGYANMRDMKMPQVRMAWKAELKMQVLNRTKFTGQELYELVARILETRNLEHSDPKAASLFLNSIGIDGIKYPTQYTTRRKPATDSDPFNYVIFDASKLNIKDLVNLQEGYDKAKGAAVVSADGSAVIYALTDPNVSTPMHELSHVFEKYLTEDERTDVLEWSGSSAWTTKTSEAFARGAEKYLAEGVAPTPALAKIFARFKAWLIEIYNGITGSEIDIQLNDKMRAIYASMFTEKPPSAKTNPGLAPKGEILSVFGPMAEQGGPVGETARRIIDDVARIRTINPQLTDAHEREIARFAQANPNPDVIKDTVLKAIDRNTIIGIFNPDAPLDLNAAQKHGATEAGLKAEVKALQGELKSVTDSKKKRSDSMRKQTAAVMADNSMTNEAKGEQIRKLRENFEKANDADNARISVLTNKIIEAENRASTAQDVQIPEGLFGVRDETQTKADGQVRAASERVPNRPKQTPGPDAVRVRGDGRIPTTGQVESRQAEKAGEIPEPGQVRPPLVYATRDGVPIPAEIVSPDRYDMDEHQLFATNSVLQRFSNPENKGYLLAHGAGVGKTSIILAIADQTAPKGKVLIVSENKQIFAGSFANDSKRMGIDLKKFETATYTDLAAGKAGKGDYELVIYDEAHNLKNKDAKKTIAAFAVKAKHELFATATPMDTPSGAVYFASKLTGRKEDEVWEMLGFTVRVFKDKDTGIETKTFEFSKGANFDTVKANIVSLRDDMIREGSMIRAEYPFYGEIKDVIIELEDDAYEDMDAIENYWDDRLDEYERPSFAVRMNLMGQKSGELSRYNEYRKIDNVIASALREIEQGRSVVIIAEGVNETYIKGIDQTIPGFLTEIKRRFEAMGIDVAEVYGAGDKSKAVQSFQEGRVKVALGTPKSAGTGINLDDTIGDRPRSLFMVTANYSGNLFEQILGRISRRNTKSASRLFVMFTESHIDGRRRQIVSNKLNTMRAIQAGIISDDNLNFEELGAQQDAAFTRGDSATPGTGPKIVDGPKGIALQNTTPAHAIIMRALGGNWDGKMKQWDFSTAARPKVEAYIQASAIPGFDVTAYVNEIMANREGVMIATGISAEPVTNQKFIIKGDTKRIKDLIKSMGGKWDGAQVGWTFPTSSFLEVSTTVKEAIDGWGSQNKVFTTEQYRENLKKLFEKNGYLFAGVDPETGLLIGKLAAYHMEAGARKFGHFATRMIKSAGQQVIPYLRQVYERAASLLNIDASELSTDAEITQIENQVKRTIRFPATTVAAMAGLEDAYNLIIDPKVAAGTPVAPKTALGLSGTAVTTLTMQERAQRIHIAMTEVAHQMHVNGRVASYPDFLATMKRYYKNRFTESQIRAGWVSMLVGKQRAASTAASRSWYGKLEQKIAGGLEAAQISMFEKAYDFRSIRNVLKKKVYSKFYGFKVMQDVAAGIYGDPILTDDKDVWQFQKLLPGMMSNLQHELTDIDNPRSKLSLIYKRIADLGVETGDWNTYEKSQRSAAIKVAQLETLQKELDRHMGAGNTAQAQSITKEINALKEVIRNLRQKMVDSVKNDKVQMFLHASHAIDRNRVLAKEVQDQMDALIEEIRELREAGTPDIFLAPLERNHAALANELERRERGAGMSTKEAQDWLDELTDAERADLQEIADMVYELNDDQLNLRVKFGLITQAYADELRGKWGPTYVPLMREQLDSNGFHIDDNPTGYSATGVSGTGMYRAYGSDKPVMNILMSIKMRTDTAILKGGQNELLNTVANLLDATDKTFGYTRGMTEDKAFLRDNLTIPFRRKTMETRMDPATGDPVAVEVIQDELIVIDKAYKLAFDALVQRAERGPAAQMFVQMMSSMMNYLRMVRTTLVPSFAIGSNPQRDLGTSLLNTTVRFGWKTAGRQLRNAMYDQRTGRFMPHHQGVWDYIQGKDTPMARQYRRLRELGGTTGVFSRKDPSDIYQELERTHKQIQKFGPHANRGYLNPAKYGKAYMDFMVTLNEIMENATRLNTFNTALEQGYSEKHAALVALENTTNFNESGDWGFAFKMIYQFANSSIQGNVTIYQLAKENPGRFIAVATLLASIGIALSEWNDWIDEEEHRRLRATQPWLFETGMVILMPNGVAFRLYLPFGYNVFKVAGDLAHAYQTGKIGMDEAATSMAQSIADSYNPFDGSRAFEAGLDGLALSATPTVARPLMEILTNRAFTGPIYSPFELARAEQTGAPDYTIIRKNIDPTALMLSRYFAKAGVDVSPNTIEYLASFYTGSLGREAWNVRKILDSDAARRDGIEIPWTDAEGNHYKIMPNMIPVISRVVRTFDRDRTAMSMLYASMNRIARTEPPIGSDRYKSLTKDMISAYNILADSQAYDAEDRENTLKQMNDALLNNYRRTVVTPAVIDELRGRGLTGADKQAERKKFYDNYNKLAAKTAVIEKFPDVPTGKINRMVKGRLYESGRGNILDGTTIEIIETQL